MDKQSLSKKLRLGSLLCAAFSAVIEIISVLLCYDGTSNYFDHQAILPTVAVMFALLGAVSGIVSAAMTKKDELNATVFSEKTAFSPATIGFFTAAVFTFYYSAKAANPTVGYVAAALLLCGAVYSVMTSVKVLRQKNNLTAFFGILAILGTILLNAYYYFDVSIEMNAPFKLTTQMGLLCISVYLTAEIRYLLGTQKPKLFLALCTTLVSVGSLCSLSLLIAFFFDKTDRGDYVAGALLVFCSILSTWLRMRNLLSKTATDNITETAEVTE